MSKVRSKKMLPKTFGDILDDLMGIGGPRSSSRNKLKISKKKKKEELKDKVTLSSKNKKLSTIKKPLTYGK